MTQAALHVPVLVTALMKALQPRLPKQALILDATFGAGGYSKCLLEAGYRVRATDRDPSVTSIATLITAASDDFEFAISRFSQLNPVTEHIFSLPRPAFNACIFDIGVSSMQLDSAARGFSFMRDGPLDMRMNPDDRVSAADLVNWKSEKELSLIFYNVNAIIVTAIIQICSLERSWMPISLHEKLSRRG